MLFVDKCAGGTSLKKQLGVYVSSHTMKFQVCITFIHDFMEVMWIQIIFFACVYVFYASDLFPM